MLNSLNQVPEIKKDHALLFPNRQYPHYIKPVRQLGRKCEAEMNTIKETLVLSKILLQMLKKPEGIP